MKVYKTGPQSYTVGTILNGKWYAGKKIENLSSFFFFFFFFQ